MRTGVSAHTPRPKTWVSQHLREEAPGPEAAHCWVGIVQNAYHYSVAGGDRSPTVVNLRVVAGLYCCGNLKMVTRWLQPARTQLFFALDVFFS